MKQTGQDDGDWSLAPGRKILVGVNDSEAAEVAVRWIAACLWEPGDEVHLLTVQFHSTLVNDDCAQLLKIDAYKFMYRRFAPVLRDAGIPFVCDVLRVSTYAAQPLTLGSYLCDAARRLHAAALVLGTDGGRHLAQRLHLAGSVTRHCLELAPVRVYVVPLRPGLRHRAQAPQPQPRDQEGQQKRAPRWVAWRRRRAAAAQQAEQHGGAAGGTAGGVADGAADCGD